MEMLDYKLLYALQDKVLDAIFPGDTGFYLTGGTCLHRFYHEHRYSADLDLFTNDGNMFRDDVRLAKERLDACSIVFEALADTRDFVRLLIEGKLQVDMVNDRVYRFGKPIATSRGLLLDNLENLCANKICAVLGRDEPKDVFDLYTLFQASETDWSAAMAAAHKKCLLDYEVLEYRFSSFPLDLLDLLHVPDKGFIAEMKQNYSHMLEKLRDLF